MNEMSVSILQLVITSGVLLATAFGLWVNLNNEVTKLKSRVYHLEQSDTELKGLLLDIAARLQHIEILLAANKIKE